MNESCVVSHVTLSVMSHIWNQSCCTYKRVMLCICMSHVIHMNQSCNTNECVISNSRRDRFAKMKFTGQGTEFVRDVYIYPKKSATYRQKSPIYPQKRRIFLPMKFTGQGTEFVRDVYIYPKKSTTHPQKSPIYPQQRRIFLPKSLILPKRAQYCQKALYGLWDEYIYPRKSEVNTYTHERAQHTRKRVLHIRQKNLYICKWALYIRKRDARFCQRAQYMGRANPSDVQVTKSVRCDITYIPAKEPDISAKETYISAKVPYM